MDLKCEIKNLVQQNNITADPKFLNPGGDFHLQAGSPAFDAGIDTGLNKDFDHVSVTGKPDIGAFEWVKK